MDVYMHMQTYVADVEQGTCLLDYGCMGVVILDTILLTLLRPH